MISGVPAWKPHATFADVTTPSRPASSVTSSPRPALRSTVREPSAGIGDVEGQAVVAGAVAQLVVQGAGVRVVAEHVESQHRVAELARVPGAGVHDRRAVALATLVGVHLDVVDERHRRRRAQPQLPDAYA